MGWSDVELGCAVRCEDGSVGVVCVDDGRLGCKLCRADGEIETDEFGFDVLYRHTKLNRLPTKEAGSAGKPGEIPWIADCWASWLKPELADEPAAGDVRTPRGGAGTQAAPSSSRHCQSVPSLVIAAAAGTPRPQAASRGAVHTTVDTAGQNWWRADDGDDWRAGLPEDWRTELSDLGRHLVEEAEDAAVEQTPVKPAPSFAVKELYSRGLPDGSETEEEYEQALRTSGDTLEDLRYLRPELSAAGILAIMDEEHKQEMWEAEQHAMQKMGNVLSSAQAFMKGGDRTHQLRMRGLWEAEQHAKGKLGANSALQAAGALQRMERDAAVDETERFSGTALGNEISEGSFHALRKQCAADRRLDLTGEAFAKLTESGLMELPGLFPEAEELFYDPRRVAAKHVNVLAERLPLLCCAHLGGTLSPSAFDTMRAASRETKQLDLSAPDVFARLSESALAEIPRLFPNIEAIFMPKKALKLAGSSDSFALRTQHIRRNEWLAAAQQDCSELATSQVRLSGQFSVVSSVIRRFFG